LSTEVQEVKCSVWLVLEVKDDLNNGADGRVQGRDAQITVPTSPSSVITEKKFDKLDHHLREETFAIKYMLSRIPRKHAMNQELQDVSSSQACITGVARQGC
jgi:hypothetical protein